MILGGLIVMRSGDGGIEYMFREETFGDPIKVPHVSNGTNLRNALANRSPSELMMLCLLAQVLRECEGAAAYVPGSSGPTGPDAEAAAGQQVGGGATMTPSTGFESPDRSKQSSPKTSFEKAARRSSVDPLASQQQQSSPRTSFEKAAKRSSVELLASQRQRNSPKTSFEKAAKRSSVELPASQQRDYR